MEAGKIERVISGSDEGAGIRVVRGENTAYGYTTELTKEGLLELARQVAVGVGDSRGTDRGKGSHRNCPRQKRESPVLLPVSQRPDQVGIDKKVALVLEGGKGSPGER